VNRNSVIVLSGSLTIAVYLAFTVAAYAGYPRSFSPGGNWLSDLGNPLLNPSHALIYRLGCILTGVILVVFFAALAPLRSGQPKRVRVYLLIAQALGALGGLALMLTGVFSEGTHSSHSFWSAVLYISFGTAVFFIGLAYLFIPGFSRKLSYLAFAITACDWVMAAFNQTHFLEWIVVALMLMFVGALSVRVAGRACGRRVAARP
jgi:hypothetical membrane protein